MTPASRGKTGLGLGLILVLADPGGIILFRRSGPALGSDEAEGPLLCLAQEPQFHQGGAGQRPRGQRTGAGLCHAGGGSDARGDSGGGAQPPNRRTRPNIGAAPCTRKSSGKPPANAPFAAWTWCRSSQKEAPAPAAPAPGAPAAPPKERKIKYWVSPMDPGYVRDKPGKAPCGMDMVPVYEEAGRRREPRAPLRFRPPPSSPWGCGPPRWKSAPCPGIP